MSASAQQLACLRIGWESAKARRNPANECVCPICGTRFLRRGSRKNRTGKPCCSRACRNVSLTGKPGNGGPDKLGIVIQCAVCGKDTYRHRSKPGRRYCSSVCRGADPASRQKISGPNHYAWKGGISPANQAQRKSREYSHWRTAVFRRDGFTCQRCGQKGRRLHAHHLKSWADHPQLRFELSNGQTLCLLCHASVHNRPFK